MREKFIKQRKPPPPLRGRDGVGDTTPNLDLGYSMIFVTNSF
jgi:hypothetical protein